jgi:hypothetical protein
MTRPFRIAQLSPNTVADVHSQWAVINLDPVYQRRDDIWEDSKRQLFIDSLINGYDIPKLYFHDLSWKLKGPNKRYAIIDGKQRLEAIHRFIEGMFALSDEFEDIEEGEPGLAGRAAGLGYRQLASKHPDLKARFDQFQLPIVLVQTDDLESIEEMFSRLNEAVPLNAPEKRNAFGGPLPQQIRRLAQGDFFVSRVAFQNARYRHLDLSTKFLYIEYRNGLADLKKRDLDGFVKEFKARHWVKRAARLYNACKVILDKMGAVFIQSDPLLASVGMITLYYQLFRDAHGNGWLEEITRDRLVKFNDAREQNRARVRTAQELALQGKPVPKGVRINAALVAFERYVQSPNDVAALTQRYRLLRRSVRKGDVSDNP